MNETRYYAPQPCACGKHTAKLEGLIRTYDYDGRPEDLERPTVLEEMLSEPDVSGYHLRLPDGCAIVER
jgi:hypothetical protein